MEKLIISNKLCVKLLKTDTFFKAESRASGLVFKGTARVELKGGVVTNRYTELNIDPPEWGNYLDLRNDGRVSYTPKGEPATTPDNKWKREGRGEIKASKLLRHLCMYDMIILDDLSIQTSLGVEVDTEDKSPAYNRAIELLNEKMKRSLELDFTLSGNVAEIYSMPLSETVPLGILSDSCMQYHEYDYFGQSLYNDAGVKVLYATDKDGDLIGRALVWEGMEDSAGNKFTYMDRAYGSNKTIIEFNEYAKENGWAYFLESGGIETPYNNSRLCYKVDILSSINDLEKAPYMDTMSYYDLAEKMFVHGRCNNPHVSFGDSTGDADVYCSCGASWHIEKSYNDIQEMEGFYYCSQCGIHWDGDVYPKEFTVRLEGRGTLVPQDADIVVEYDGRYYHEDDIAPCSECGDQHPTEDFITGTDYDGLCRKCVAELLSKNREVFFIRGKLLNKEQYEEKCTEWLGVEVLIK